MEEYKPKKEGNVYKPVKIRQFINHLMKKDE